MLTSLNMQVLLLGAGESGKSTFGKQLKLLNKGTISAKEKIVYRKGARDGSDMFPYRWILAAIMHVCVLGSTQVSSHPGCPVTTPALASSYPRQVSILAEPDDSMKGAP